jgi:hypothetical protein
MLSGDATVHVRWHSSPRRWAASRPTDSTAPRGTRIRVNRRKTLHEREAQQVLEGKPIRLGDLDPNGVRIFRHLRRARSRQVRGSCAAARLPCFT